MGGQGTFLGKNKEVFDAEVYAVLQAVKIINAREEEGQLYDLLGFPGSHSSG